MQTLYSYSGNDASEMKRAYLSVVQRECWDGASEVDPSGRLEITIKRAIAHPITLLRCVTRCGISFRRSWQHVRDHNAGVQVICFIRQGPMKIVRPGATCVA